MTDRASLLALVAALDASPLALRRDECGDWRILGKLGHVYADGAGYLLCVVSDESVRRWSNVKARCGFCRLVNDGDDEGCLRLHRLPTPKEATFIREAIGIRKRRAVTGDARAQLERARTLLIRPLAA